jgi:hypothetical protein
LSGKVSVERCNTSVFTELGWLAKAMGKDIDRPVYTVISVIGGKGYATDGRRMHIVEKVGIADGVYKITRNTRQVIELEPADIKPPDYKRVIPKPREVSQPVEIAADGYESGVKEGSVVMALARACTLPCCFNLTYLLGALDIEDSGVGAFTFRWKDGTCGPLVVEYRSTCSRRKALVMGWGDA